MKYALITMIESNDKNLNEDKGISFCEKRLYEDEALLCFKTWRERGGWLKDIPIYTFCPTKNIISEKTKEELQKLNVTYIERYLKETESFISGFYNVPLCGSIFEKELKEDIFIHIDLDMNLIKPLPESLVNKVADNKFVLVGQYDDESAKEQRQIGDDWDNPLDTGFIISHRDSGFYQFFYERLMALTVTAGDERWKKNCIDIPMYFLEEYVIDCAYNEKQYPIVPIERYQIGEGYAKVSTFTDEELSNVYFWHEHILYEKGYYDKVKEKLEYAKRMGRI